MYLIQEIRNFIVYCYHTCSTLQKIQGNTVVSTKVVLQQPTHIRDNADWYYGLR